MSILYFILALNFAIIPQGSIDMYGSYDILSPTEDYKIGFSPEIVILETIFIGGNLNVYMDHRDLLSTFTPKILDSQFYVKIDFNWINFQFLHRCTHPIVAWAHSERFKKIYESAYRELKIEFVTKYNVF